MGQADGSPCTQALTVPGFSSLRSQATVYYIEEKTKKLFTKIEYPLYSSSSKPCIIRCSSFLPMPKLYLTFIPILRLSE